MVSYLYRARATYGSTYGILRALRDGRVFADLGDDAEDVLAALIGAGDLIDSCF